MNVEASHHANEPHTNDSDKRQKIVLKHKDRFTSENKYEVLGPILAGKRYRKTSVLA